jgi:hypothetical protein
LLQKLRVIDLGQNCLSAFPMAVLRCMLLEDLDLVQRLNRGCGPPAIVPAAVRTSGRRWRRLGLLRTTLINQAILAGHALGVDVHALAAMYER